MAKSASKERDEEIKRAGLIYAEVVIIHYVSLPDMKMANLRLSDGFDNCHSTRQ